MPFGQANARELAKPDFIALYFYADWCPSCQILSPKLETARSEGDLDKSGILFVKLDLSDKSRVHQSILLAQAMSVGDFLKQQGSATGYVAILDAHSKEEVYRFNSSASVKDIKDRLISLHAND